MSLSERNQKLWSEHAFHTIGAPISASVQAAMDAARAEGEAAGVQKAEQAADGTIIDLESKLLAALYLIPDDTLTGTLRRKKEQLLAERKALEARAENAEAELNLVENSLRFEAEGRCLLAEHVPLSFTRPAGDTIVTDRSSLVAIERAAEQIADSPCNDAAVRRCAQLIGRLASQVAPR